MNQVTVVVCGAKHRNGSLAKTLKRALSAYGGVQWYDGETIACPEKSPGFLVYECAKVPAVISGKGILVFDNGFKMEETKPAEFSDGFIPILDGENQEAAKILRGTGKIAVTCSASSKGTLSIASIDEDRASISLQRDIRLLNETVAEPMEIIAALSQKTPAYPLMAACGVLLLAGIEGNYAF